MKRQDDDSFSPTESKYEYYLKNPGELDEYLKNASEVDIVAFYKYTIKRIEELKDKEPENLKIYWAISKKLRETESVTKYLAGEIQDEDISRYITREETEIQQILDALEKRKKLSPIQKIKRFLKG